jgi:hypothetical protein
MATFRVLCNLESVHVGTAVLQLYAELGMVPMERRFARIRDVFKMPEGERPEKALEEELDRLEGRYRLFQIDFFKQYKWLVGVNSIVALMLAVLLAMIAYKADDAVTEYFWWFPIGCIALAFLPAPIILGCLSFDAWRRLKPIKDAVDDLGRRL